MQDSLGVSSASRGVQQEEWVFSIYPHRGTIVRLLIYCIWPPNISAIYHICLTSTLSPCMLPYQYCAYLYQTDHDQPFQQYFQLVYLDLGCRHLSMQYGFKKTSGQAMRCMVHPISSQKSLTRLASSYKWAQTADKLSLQRPDSDDLWPRPQFHLVILLLS